MEENKNCRNCKKYINGCCCSKELSIENKFADSFNLRSESGEIQEVIKEIVECTELLSDFIKFAIETVNELGMSAKKSKHLNKALTEESENLLNELSCEIDIALCKYFLVKDTTEEENALHIMNPDKFCCKDWE